MRKELKKKPTNHRETYLQPTELSQLKDDQLFPNLWKTLSKVEVLLQESRQKINELPIEQSWLQQLRTASRAKISKGLNLKGQPYRILDHPAVFSKEGHLAFRHLFIWGHYFSTQLLLTGQYFDRVNKVLVQESPYLLQQNSQLWNHFVDKDRYLPAQLLDEELWQKLSKVRILKLASQHAIEQYAHFPDHTAAFVEQNLDLFK